MRASLLPLLVLGLLAACGAGTDPASGAAPPSLARPLRQANLTLLNSHWADLLAGRDGLRTGQALYLQTITPGLFSFEAEVVVTVENLRSGKQATEVRPLADRDGVFEMVPLLNDVGLEDGILPGDELEVVVAAGAERFTARLAVRSRNVDELSSEVVDPLVYAADAAGRPSNAFVIGDHLPEEVGGTVYVAGEGFPARVTEVDLYVVEDRDRWAGQTIPRRLTEGRLAGPIPGKIMGGRLLPTSTGFTPTQLQLGTYDILVDVNRNGVFDYRHDLKDGCDGEAQIGFTVQRSARWLATLKSKHLLLNLAYDSARRVGGRWRNVFRFGEKVFIYVNPPVNAAHHQAKVRKWIVAHRDFQSFWDKPGADGTVDFQTFAMSSSDSVPQIGCTNTPPIYVMTAGGAKDPESGEPVSRFDVVLDYDRDGRYNAGVDLLDVGGLDEGAGLTSPDALRAAPAALQGGFRVEP